MALFKKNEKTQVSEKLSFEERLNYLEELHENISENIGFGQLSGPLKVLYVWGWISLGIYSLLFIIGMLIG